MRVLIAYGSKRGGTAGLAYMLRTALQERGLVADVKSCEHVDTVDEYDAVVVGGAVYAGRWHRDAKRLLRRVESQLQQRPVWLFSSGPLDDSAAHRTLPPVRAVAELVQRVNAVEHVTFGGRLDPAAKGRIAHAMAKTHAGDWRDQTQVDHLADRIAYRLADLGAAAPTR
jgi:menaquinone-dependent protoporphyrinogen oxidase